jgi:hypothetical protein
MLLVKFATAAVLIAGLALFGGCSSSVGTPANSAVAANTAVTTPSSAVATSANSKGSSVQKQTAYDPDAIPFGSRRWWEEQERDSPGTP